MLLGFTLCLKMSEFYEDVDPVEEIDTDYPVGAGVDSFSNFAHCAYPGDDIDEHAENNIRREPEEFDIYGDYSDNGYDGDYDEFVKRSKNRVKLEDDVEEPEQVEEPEEDIYGGPFDADFDAAAKKRGQASIAAWREKESAIAQAHACQGFIEYIVKAMTTDDYYDLPEELLVFINIVNPRLFSTTINRALDNSVDALGLCKTLLTGCYDILDNLMYCGGDANPIVVERKINDAITVLEGKYNTLFWEANQHLLPIESRPPYRIGPLP